MNSQIANGVRSMLVRVLGLAAGANLSLFVTVLVAQQVIPPSATTPQQLATVETIKYLLFITFALLGSGCWAAARPPGLDKYFSDDTRYRVARMIFVGFAFGMLAVVIGLWRDWNQFKTTAYVFGLSLTWEFIMLAVRWAGRRFSKNPLQFIQDMRAGKAVRERSEEDRINLDDTQSRRPRINLGDDGDLH